MYDPLTECVTADGVIWEQPDLFAVLYHAAAMRAAILQTLDENGHLTGGENCTLILLKRAIETPNDQGQGSPLAGDPLLGTGS